MCRYALIHGSISLIHMVAVLQSCSSSIEQSQLCNTTIKEDDINMLPVALCSANLGDDSLSRENQVSFKYYNTTPISISCLNKSGFDDAKLNT